MHQAAHLSTLGQSPQQAMAEEGQLTRHRPTPPPPPHARGPRRHRVPPRRTSDEPGAQQGWGVKGVSLSSTPWDPGPPAGQASQPPASPGYPKTPAAPHGPRVGVVLLGASAVLTETGADPGFRTTRPLEQSRTGARKPVAPAPKEQVWDPGQGRVLCGVIRQEGAGCLCLNEIH